MMMTLPITSHHLTVCEANFIKLKGNIKKFTTKSTIRLLKKKYE